jgi:hypothetical protein
VATRKEHGRLERRLVGDHYNAALKACFVKLQTTTRIEHRVAIVNELHDALEGTVLSVCTQSGPPDALLCTIDNAQGWTATTGQSGCASCRAFIADRMTK